MLTSVKIKNLETFDFEIIQFKLQDTLASQGDLYVVSEEDANCSGSSTHYLGFNHSTTTGIQLVVRPSYFNDSTTFEEDDYDDSDWKYRSTDEDDDLDWDFLDEDDEDDEDYEDYEHYEDEEDVLDAEIEEYQKRRNKGDEDHLRTEYLDITMYLDVHACKEDLIVAVSLLRTIKEIYPECEVYVGEPKSPSFMKRLGALLDIETISVEREYELRSLRLYAIAVDKSRNSFIARMDGHKRIETSAEAIDWENPDMMAAVAPLWNVLKRLSALDPEKVFIPSYSEYILNDIDLEICATDFYNHADTLMQPSDGFVCLHCGYARKIVRKDMFYEMLGDNVIYPTDCKAYYIIPRMSHEDYEAIFDSCPGIEMGERRAFLMRWNPRISDFKLNVYRRMIASPFSSSQMHWAVTDWQHVSPDDYAFLACVGTDYDGLVGGGPILELPSKGRDWCDKSRPRKYVDFSLDMAINPKSEYRISAERLESVLPEIDWHGGHSGVLLPPEAASTLMGIWQHKKMLYDYSGMSYLSPDISIPGDLPF